MKEKNPPGANTQGNFAGLRVHILAYFQLLAHQRRRNRTRRLDDLQTAEDVTLGICLDSTSLPESENSG